MATASYILPIYASILLVRYLGASSQQLQIMQSFSLILLGGILSTWATLNFSLALTVGLLASPLGFIRPLPLRPSADTSSVQQKLNVVLSIPLTLAWLVLSPPTVLYALSVYFQKELSWMLLEVAKGWIAQGAWSVLVLWSVWWPAWVVGGIVLVSGAVKTV